MNITVIGGNISTDIFYAEREIGGVKTPVANFNVACNYGMGQYRKTAFFHVTLWRKAAELIKQYGEKGKGIMVSGAVALENYMATNKETNQSEIRHTLAIPNVDYFEFTNGSRSGERVYNEVPPEAAETEECPFVPDPQS